MIDGIPVIDAVAHGYNLDPSNFRGTSAGRKFAEVAYPLIHKALAPRDDPAFTLTPEEFVRTADPRMLADCLFRESATDLAAYHAVPLFGFLKDGGSPTWIGKAAERLAPGRFFFYGAVPPFDPARAIDEIDRQIEEDGIIGLKFYPNDLWEGELKPFRLDDEVHAFPIFEHARKRGLRSIAIHKALVLGPTRIDDYRLGDVERAALAFRDLHFEIVHGGWAFLEETVILAQCFRNVIVNLEGGSAFLNFAPKRFEALIGALLLAGCEDQIVWATGAMAVHPRPLLEKFWSFEISAQAMDEQGYPPLTRERRAKILSGNFIRMHGLDPQVVAAKCETRDLVEPWSFRRSPA